MKNTPYAVRIHPDRHNKMPLYTNMRDLYASNSNYQFIGKDFEANHSWTMNFLTNAVPFDFSDVADEIIERFLHAEGKFEHAKAEMISYFDWLNALPICVPPYPLMIVEMNTNRLTEMGRMLQVTETEQVDNNEFVSTSYLYLNLSKPNSDMGDSIMGPVSATTAAYDKTGRLLTVPPLPPGTHTTPKIKISITSREVFEQLFTEANGMRIAPNVTKLTDAIAEQLHDTLFIAALAMQTYLLYGSSILHCKNVEERPARLPRQQARFRQRHNLPFIEWKTLVVKPMRRPSTPSETSDLLDERSKKRLHTVDGHFAEYGEPYTHPDGTPKGKLFGKYSGQFFIPGHWRGLADVGTILKTYDVRKS